MLLVINIILMVYKSQIKAKTNNMDIKCKRLDCTHNSGCSCSARSINITRATLCNKYASSDHKAALLKINNNLIEASAELSPQNLKDVHLVCDSPCLYNKCGKCYANGITVIDEY
ncbi:MAG: DUF1540 domain-containing protein, partial [Firmicutes bacterium]|nr:DUF1540 domain-containing protein [Bacillota bacterium]